MTGISPPAIRPEPALWRGMSRAELDIGYDNAGHVADSAARLAAWSRRSAALRAAEPALLDRAYGPRARNRIDIFRCGRAGAPLFVFVHGGYWQRNSKEVFSCMAEGPLALGFDVALPGYTLGPEATLGEIVAEIAAALAFLRREGPGLGVATGRLVIGGWSAGGHLAALACTRPEVDAALPISGIFDLEPIRLGVLNDKLGLTPAEVAGLSPVHRPVRREVPLIVASGGGELPELQRQSRDYSALCRAQGRAVEAMVLPGRNHFSILDELVSPDGALAQALLRLAVSL
ncbi:alpha/beta hydrolase [Bosea sp. TWI1241]|uniref:alpha/beta hydrolase n=1 Tax=Bosea sp. TWI1241 TaxID=3148904 RepID=UPI00320B2517